eukprot:7654173-Alexandrium_andersonii.AAC.1
MTPTAQALQKRMAFACHEDGFEPDALAGLLQDTQSQAALRGLHAWLVTRALPCAVTLTLDEYALAFYNVVAEGVQAFLRSPE